MVKLIYATCRHCGHKFIPRVEQPRQCGACWGKWPLKSKSDSRENATNGTRKGRGK